MAKTKEQILDMLSGDAVGSYTRQPFILKWQDIYLRMSIHTTGTCPRFRPLRERQQGDGFGYGALLDTNTYITPAWWISAAYDSIFDVHLLNRHPREPQVIRELRKSFYRPYQTDPLLECIDSLKACIFGDSKYTMFVDDTSDMEYLEGNNFNGKTFIGYFEWMFKAICEDPNSLFFVRPRVKRTETNGVVEPVIVHVPSAQIVYITSEEVVFYEPFSDNNYAWWVTETGYFRFIRDEQKKKYAPDTTIDANGGWYAHLLNRTPVHFAGGIWNTLRYYDSYLKPAQAYCDDFVAAQSDVQLANKEALFPFIQMVQEDCPTCSAHGDVSWCSTCHSKSQTCNCNSDVRNIERIKCPSCDGAKYITSYNPGQRTFVPREDADKELIKIINFDVSINKHLQETADKIKEGIRASLRQQYIKEAQSGVAKEIDREGEYLYRATVSNGIWDGLIRPILVDILSLRHMVSNGTTMVPNIPQFELVKPTDFALKTEFELLEEMKMCTTSNMPEYIIKRQVEAYVDKVYGGSDVMKKKVAIIHQMDAYAVTPILTKSALLSSNAITPEEFSFSNNLPTILDSIIREKTAQWFLDASYDEIETLVKEETAEIQIPEQPQKNEEVKVVT